MSKNWLAPAGLSVLLLVTACSSNKHKKVEPAAETAYTMPVSQEGLDKVTETWPQSSKNAIQTLNSKYGLPSAVTDDMVVWNNSAPFKKSVVYKEEVSHQFPTQHSDVLMQTIDYRVPKDKVAQLSKFDGSLLVDRTKGELSARNEKEEMNILSLNLADKIIRGEMTPEEARREYSKNAESFSAGTPSQMVTGLNFKTEGNTGDPDSSMQAQEMKKPMVKKQFKSETVEEVMDQQE